MLPRFVGARFVGAKEIQDRLGVSRQRVQQLITRSDWPAPYEVLAMGKIWLRDDIEDWIRQHRPGVEKPATDQPDTT